MWERSRRIKTALVCIIALVRCLRVIQYGIAFITLQSVITSFCCILIVKKREKRTVSICFRSETLNDWRLWWRRAGIEVRGERKVTAWSEKASRSGESALLWGGDSKPLSCSQSSPSMLLQLFRSPTRFRAARTKHSWNEKRTNDVRLTGCQRDGRASIIYRNAKFRYLTRAT